jgi:hypothetical protein
VTVLLIINKYELSFLKYLALYFLGYIISIFLYKKFPNKTVEIITTIFSLPLILISSLFKISNPITSLLTNAFFYFLLSLLFPGLLVIILNKLSILNLSRESLFFIIFTCGTIISITFNKILLKITYKISPAIKNNSENEENKNLIKLSEYLITPSNIRFLIYLFYFIYLCYFSLKTLETNSPFTTKNMDNALMQAFLVFVAFDCLRINSKNIVFSPSTMLIKILNIFFPTVKINNKQSNKKNLPTNKQ